MDTQKTINEIIELLDTLWEDYPINTQAEIDAKENLRQRIEALQQNRDTEDISLRAWTEIGNTLLAKEQEWAKERAKLKKEKKDAENALVAEKKKLGEELVTKLADLAQGKDGQLSEEQKAEFKKITDALTTKTEVNFTEADTKKLATELKKEQPTNYWAIGACVFAGLTCLIATGFGIFIKSKEAK